MHGSTAAKWRTSGRPSGSRPIVGITTDLIPHNNIERHASPTTYALAVAAAGGVPVLVPPIPAALSDTLRLCDAFVLTGGDDPITEAFGVATHASAVRVKQNRQDYELALLDGLHEARPEVPVLGVCLGMQYMALHAGGTLNQHLPETHDNHAEHWDHEHELCPTSEAVAAIRLPEGAIWSRHRQAIEDAGTLAVIARAHDGVIEAVADANRPFYVGVQWHPERTGNRALGQDVFDALVRAVAR